MNIHVVDEVDVAILSEFADNHADAMQGMTPKETGAYVREVVACVRVRVRGLAHSARRPGAPACCASRVFIAWLETCVAVSRRRELPPQFPHGIADRRSL